MYFLEKNAIKLFYQPVHKKVPLACNHDSLLVNHIVIPMNCMHSFSRNSPGLLQITKFMYGHVGDRGEWPLCRGGHYGG